MKIIQRGLLHFERSHLHMDGWVADCEGTPVPGIERLNTPQTVRSLNSAQRTMLALALCDIAAQYGVELEPVGASTLPKRYDFESERAVKWVATMSMPDLTGSKFTASLAKRPWWKRVLRRP